MRERWRAVRWRSKSWRKREEERGEGYDGLTLVRALTPAPSLHCAATKVESNVFFVQPFPREHPSTLLDSLEHKFLWESLRITRANVQRINSWVSELTSWINMFCVASRRFVLVPGNVSRCLFFFPCFYLSTWIVVNRKFIISLNKKGRIICFANNRVVKIFNPFQNNFHVTDIIEISINWLIVVEKGINFPCFI